MIPIEEQILINQIEIMRFLNMQFNSPSLEYQINESVKFLNDNQLNQKP